MEKKEIVLHRNYLYCQDGYNTYRVKITMETEQGFKAIIIDIVAGLQKRTLLTVGTEIDAIPEYLRETVVQ
jgi:hypothetical protein